MRTLVIVGFLLVLASSGVAQPTDSIANPVLPGVADSGVLRYNGEYYLMGVNTRGRMYRSSDLVHWTGPRKAFSMNNDWTRGPAAEDQQIHASDLAFVNGTFHHYWSVNYWGEPKMTVRIGHATAEAPMGPYREPVTETWFDSRIDAHFFQDDDGTPYFYSVKFADGNVIYGQKMADPWTRIGSPTFLLSARPGTWEARAHRINEGAEVDRYRGRYYMLYASNHVSARWGQYAIGVAEADDPLGFNNASKYDHPVIGPTNEERIESNSEVHVPIGGHVWRYTTEAPDGKGWTQRGFDDSSWREGAAAFGSRFVDGSTTNRTTTRWKSRDLWLRTTFHLDTLPSNHLQLLLQVRGRADVYVNGERIHRSEGTRFYATVDVEDVGAFRRGENVLSVHARRAGADPQYVDVGVIDPRDRPGEAYMFSPGQPNLVRGPNGFSWWLVYLARFDGSGKSQFVDRVHFFDDRLTVDGPTGPRTPGIHPAPRPPTVGDRFSETDRTALGEGWTLEGGDWRVQEGEALQANAENRSNAIVAEPGGRNYLFESGVRFVDGSEGRAGVVAFQNEGDDRAEVYLDRADTTWGYRVRENGRSRRESFALADTFDFDAYHSFRITKNAGTVRVRIDGRPAPGASVIETGLEGAGRPGMMTESATAAFDGVVYTRGWDEFDTRVDGWNPRGPEGAWSVDSTGLQQRDSTGSHLAVKGHPLDAYEFSAQVYSPVPDPSSERGRRLGIRPVYVDDENWLQAVVDPDRNELVVQRTENGETTGQWRVDLTRERRLWPDAVYSDRFAKRYTFRSVTRLDSLRVWTDSTGNADPIPAAWNPEYRRDGTWAPFPEGGQAVLADAVRLDRGDEGEPIGPLTARVKGTSTYNLRALKRPGEIILFVDGEQVLRVLGDWPASRVGLVTENTRGRFDGIQRFEIPVGDAE